ncbi:SAM-dependent methyltransferase [Raineyella sp. LH-20]|uniref:SAM-dependent methyltransferase n=1 Tax=Raineyella sp. LH-20 TaxID=3081204 RepID=UPI00295389FD|nr:SAM-dependent methyltransferase [Raineyella sp. LH-20]WOP17253.1 hypothetical protein R0146_08115 [Raineyella sp. LH-20]
MPATPTPRTGPPDTARGTTPIIGLVDLGAGDGSLLRAVAAARPDWSLLGVDVRQAPSDLPPGCSWRRAVWDVRSASWTGPSGPLGRPPWHDLATRGPVMVVAHEWLDELPCRIAQRTADGWELLGPDGPTGDRAAADELAWLTEWAGAARGVEVGLTRDRAWAAVASALPHGGILVAVDYGHRRADRPPEGGLIGYRDGRRVPPVPDRRTNLSAPVAVDALAAAIESLPRVRRHTIARQHELVSRPAPAAPRAPLAALVAANRRRALADPDRWGANWWLVHTVDAGNGSATS